MKNSTFKLSAILFFTLIIFSFSSCVSAQKNEPQNNTKEKPNQSVKQISSFISSVTSCQIIEIPKKSLPNEFYPFGGFISNGKLPADFQNFDNFTLDIPTFLDKPNEISDSAESLKVIGALVTRSFDKEPYERQNYPIEQLSLSPDKINFTTETFNNVHYEFSGNFLKKGNFVDFNASKTIVLEGNLKKFEQSKAPQEAILRFSFKVWKARLPIENCSK